MIARPYVKIKLWPHNLYSNQPTRQITTSACSHQPQSTGIWSATASFPVSPSSFLPPSIQLGTKQSKAKYATLTNHKGLPASPWPTSSFPVRTTAHWAQLPCQVRLKSFLFSIIGLSQSPACLGAFVKYRVGKKQVYSCSYGK